MKQYLSLFRQSYLLNSFSREPIAILSLVVLLVLVLSAILCPFIAPYNPYDLASIDILESDIPPFWHNEGVRRFILGTDHQGRDMFSAMLYGLRTSILIGFGAVFLQSILGVTLGLLAGYYGGRIGAFVMRVADIQLSFSTLMVAIFASAILQATFGVHFYETFALPMLILIIGAAQWPTYGRTVRASVMAEKTKEYVEAARVLGFNSKRIMWRHILPNTLSPVFVISTLQLARAIMNEAALSFLGLGMPVSKPSLGSLINSGFSYIFSGAWWLVFFPGALLCALIFAINLLGDWVRKVLNPKLYKD